MDEAELDYWTIWIGNLTQLECARFWRFAPVGHIVFADIALYELFVERFKSVGGMTRTISRQVGWREEQFNEERIRP